jgi:hypothetical protein
MDFKSMIGELRKEREALDAAIARLERIQRDRHSVSRRDANLASASTNGTNQSGPAPDEG